MKRQVLVFLLIGILFAGIGAYVGVKRLAPVAATDLAGAQLLAQSLPNPKGEQVRLDQYRGRPLLVNFWATWCPPCVEEMPELNLLQKEIGAAKLQIVGIGIDSPSNIVEFAAKQKIDYPLLVAGTSGTELSRQLGNKAGGLPYTVLLDGAGRVRKQYLGRLKMDELRRDLQGL
ncbi:MAG: TlpA family protein disulfide reductase [Paucimonas sp.]|nr:TlpA family protein disulfide reductase [Paucimonas sp.]